MNKVQILREVVTKLTPMIAGRGLRVTQIGTQALCECDRDGKPIRINIPHIADDADDAFCDAIQGFIDHEVAHALFTDWATVFECQRIGAKKALERGWPTKQGAERMHSLTNLIEDTFIEREMCKRFKGTGYNLDRLYAIFLHRITVKALAAHKGQVEQEFNILLMPLIRSWAGQAEFHRFLDASSYWEQPLIAALIKMTPPALINRIKTAKDSWEVMSAAEALFDILYPPPPPAPPMSGGGAGEGAPSEKPRESHEDEKTTDEKAKDDDCAGGGDGDGKDDAEDEEPGDEKGKGGKADEKEDIHDGEEGEEAEADPEDGDEGDRGEAEDEGDEESAGGRDGDRDEDEGDDGDSAGGKDAGDEEDDGSEDGDGDKDAVGKDDSESDDEDDGSEAGDDDAAGDDEGDADKDKDKGDEPSDKDDGEDDDTAETSSGSDTSDDGGEDGDVGTAGGEGEDEGEKTGEAAGAASDGSEVAESPFADIEVDPPSDLSKEIATMIGDESLRQTRVADYTVLTRDWDRLEPPKVDGVNETLLRRLDEETRHMVAPMQKAIERMMAARSHALKVPGYRSGKLHGASLYRLTHDDDRVFRRIHVHRTKETAVTLLVDNSGSMRGSKVRVAQQAAYALSQTLERVGVKHEVLGFTCYDPSPSQMRIVEEETRRLGRSYVRIEPLFMPLYKGFEERINPAIKKRFVAGYDGTVELSGNIDGESVRYAGHRLLQRKEVRKVMIVMSDGMPAGWNGHQRELYADLHRAVAELTQAKVEVVGLGIMTEAVSTFYPKFSVLKKLDELPKAVMGELTRILATV